MPLPKTASIAARATEVYSEAWTVLLQKCWGIPPVKEDDLADLFQLLPYLRQLLTCCACAGLLEDAMISLVCGHCYCYQCQFRAPLLKIQCRQCRERSGLVMENQIRLLVDCYKRMCLILASELHHNPLILTVKGKDPTQHGAGDKEKGRGKGCDKDSSELKVKTKTASSVTFNPITEILKEVQEGTKVSRAVLVIKPPAKYVNAKLMLTPKKDQTLGTKNTSTVTEKVAKHQEVSKEAENKSPIPAEEKGKKKRGRKAKRQLPMSSTPSRTEETPEASSREGFSKNQEKEEGGKKIPSTSSTFVTDYDLAKAKLAVDNFKPSHLEITTRSLDNRFIDVSSDGIVIKDSMEHRTGDECVSEVNPTMFTYVRFKLDKDGNRKRVWNPLCPRVVVKRRRASIDKMMLLQTKTVCGKLRSKERRKKVCTPPAEPLVEVAQEQGHEMEPAQQQEDDMEHLLLEQEHALQFDPNIDPDLELDASWLEELCEGIEENITYFAHSSSNVLTSTFFISTSPSTNVSTSIYTPAQHHLPPPPHFSPHHLHLPPGFLHHHSLPPPSLRGFMP